MNISTVRQTDKKDTPSRKNRKKSLTELAELQKPGAELTPEEAERLAVYRRKKADQQTHNEIKLYFHKEMAYRVYDEFDINQIQIGKDGDLVVTANIPENDWLIGYLLSFGVQVEIIELVHLKKILAA